MTGTAIAFISPTVGELVDPIERVLVNLADGARTLKRACDFPGAPRPYQVLALAETDPAIAAKLAAAFESAAEGVHEEMVLVEDAVTVGAIPHAAGATVLGSKRWRLERMGRRRWATKVEVEGKVDMTLNVVLRRFTDEEPPHE